MNEATQTVDAAQTLEDAMQRALKSLHSLSDQFGKLAEGAWVGNPNDEIGALTRRIDGLQSLVLGYAGEGYLHKARLESLEALVLKQAGELAAFKERVGMVIPLTDEGLKELDRMADEIRALGIEASE